MPPSFVALSLPFGEGSIHPVVFFDEASMLLAIAAARAHFPRCSERSRRQGLRWTA